MYVLELIRGEVAERAVPSAPGVDPPLRVRVFARTYLISFPEPDPDLAAVGEAVPHRLIRCVGGAALRGTTLATFTRLSFTPSTPPPELIWSTASSAPRAMSMPVADCSPVIGPSIAITPGPVRAVLPPKPPTARRRRPSSRPAQERHNRRGRPRVRCVASASLQVARPDCPPSGQARDFHGPHALAAGPRSDDSGAQRTSCPLAASRRLCPWVVRDAGSARSPRSRA